MTKKVSQTVSVIASAAVSLTMLMSAPLQAQQTIVGEEYTPTIWIDPDGCEHWVFDDGFEGFMTPHRARDGSPVCRRQEVCGVIPSDTLFATDEEWIADAAKTQLMSFFQNANATGFLIYGHTDARASDEYNMDLSQRRADMVSRIAQAAGQRVIESRGFGERRPAVAGNSHEAYRQNRRVEIICLR
ncbi:OmpA family protein [Yoonia sp. 208BN28-4]|uniref:OmpA family protein n=1 Tax=Yoonia sp. 208BN28-4 TaxID=3126505 RepID=UPI0030A91910